MKNFFTLTLCFLTLSLTAQEPLTYPYNPDANSDQFVAVSDVLETIAIYGSDYFPSEIMVGDTTLSNWIQILNQTLANQQAVIDSLQASLDSQETQLDSTMIADMIAAAGGLGSGGGCSYSFPDGLNGEVVHFDLIDDGPYTVPEGKNLYAFKFIHVGEVVVITVDGNSVCKSRDNQYLGYDHFTPYIIGESSIVDFTTLNLDSDVESVFLTGMLVDRNVDPQVISLQGVDSGISIDSFTIPENKTFYITDAFYTPFELGNPAQVLLNGERWTETSKDDRTIAAVTFPVAIGEGNVISLEGGTSGNNHNISGYLVDEDYFADCGGGGTAIGNSLSFGVRETIILDQLTWQALPGSGWRYYTEIYPQNDGFLSGELVGGCGAKETFIVQDDFVDFTDSSLTLQGIHIQSLQNSNPVAVKYGEKIVLTGNESAYTCSQDTLSQVQWLPLISNALGSDSSNNEGGSSEGGSGGVSVSSFGDTLTINGESVIVPGVSFSNVVPEFGSVTDIDGNTYQTVIYGGVEWITENLKTTRFNNGDSITEDCNCGSTNIVVCSEPNWGYYDCDSDNQQYGYLYNGHVIQDDRKICPVNWHIASPEEWQDIFDLFNPPGYSGMGLILASGTNESFLTIPLGGEHSGANGNGYNAGSSTIYWQDDNQRVMINWNSASVNNGWGQFYDHHYIRCVKD